jgi:flagellar hook-associated protein 1 FlgK
MSFRSLNIGKRGVLTQQFAQNVVSNNISNVNTPGYARRTAVITENYAQSTKGGQQGNGVFPQSVRSYRDFFFERDFRDNNSRLSKANLDSTVVQRIETLLGEPSDGGLDFSIEQLYTAFEQASLKPEDIGLRSLILTKAESVVKQFRDIDQRVADLRSDMYVKTRFSVQEVNRITLQIANLNKEIGKFPDEESAAIFVDQRSELLTQLAKFGDVTVSNDQGGAININLGNMPVVAGTENYNIDLRESVAPSGERTAYFARVDELGNQLSVVVPNSGEFASFLNHYNQTLDDQDSSGGYTLMSRFNDLANAIGTRINDLFSTGYGLDDPAGPPPGLNFFEAQGGGAITARNIQIATSIAGQPRRLALSNAANEPGNANIALAISNLSTDQTIIAGRSAANFLNQTYSELGNIGADAMSGITAFNLVAEQLTIQRENAQGVNLDEETVDLMKFQRAFQASARVITTANELLLTVINLGR